MAWIGEQLPARQNAIPALVNEAAEQLNAAGFRTDTIDIVDADSLLPLSEQSTQAVVLMAALGWTAALVWAPLRDSDLAQAAWSQSVAETSSME